MRSVAPFLRSFSPVYLSLNRIVDFVRPFFCSLWICIFLPAFSVTPPPKHLAFSTSCSPGSQVAFFFRNLRPPAHFSRARAFFFWSKPLRSPRAGLLTDPLFCCVFCGRFVSQSRGRSEKRIAGARWAFQSGLPGTVLLSFAIQCPFFLVLGVAFFFPWQLL